MALVHTIEVKEGKRELQNWLRKCEASARPRIKLLLLWLKGTTKTKELSAKTGVSGNCISNWKQLYEKGGLSALLVERRGGHKRGAISREAHGLIEKRLGEAKGGFTSYKEAMQWINKRFGLNMKYQAVNKYLKHHFQTKLKVGRKTHIQKDPLAEAVFKKGSLREAAASQRNQAD